MVLSKRERYVVIGAIVVVAGLVVDQLILTPLLEGESSAQTRKQSLLEELNRAKVTLKESKDLQPKWRDMLRSGIKSEADEAESQALHAVRDWMEKCGVTIELLQPERPTEKTVLPEIVIRANGKGTMESIAKLLWQMQTATIPMRIIQVTLTARVTGADDLQVQIRVSTLYMPGAQQTPSPAPPAATSRPPGKTIHPTVPAGAVATTRATKGDSK